MFPPSFAYSPEHHKLHHPVDSAKDADSDKEQERDGGAPLDCGRILPDSNGPIHNDVRHGADHKRPLGWLRFEKQHNVFIHSKVKEVFLHKGEDGGLVGHGKSTFSKTYIAFWKS